ncbi:MAG: hypothetical protein Q7J24_14915 [Desulfomicrobium sp.]|nr:hypothetical protein [Desulfomicrobium sp.]
MAGKVQDLVKAVDKARSEIVVTKTRLAKAEETERELLRQILELCTDEDSALYSLWGKPGDFEAALVIGSDVAVVEITEDWWDTAAERRHESVSVKFVPCAPQGL